MLYYNTIDTGTLELLIELQKLPALKDCGLLVELHLLCKLAIENPLILNCSEN